MFSLRNKINIFEISSIPPLIWNSDYSPMSLLFVDTAGKNNYSATDIMEVIFDMEDTQTEPNMDIEVKANTTQTASHSRTTNNLVSRTSSVAAGKLFVDMFASFETPLGQFCESHGIRRGVLNGVFMLGVNIMNINQGCYKFDHLFVPVKVHIG